MPTQRWFTADLHFRTPKVTAWRPEFTSFEEHDEILIERWNKVVKRNDLCYLLGDVGAGGQDVLAKLLDRMHGTKFLLEGNHDQTVKMARCRTRFRWIKGVHDMTVDGVKLWLNHYPWVTWPGIYRGSFMLHGHCHSQLPDRPALRTMDVGVDTQADFSPWPWEEIRDKMLTRPLPTPETLGWSRPI